MKFEQIGVNSENQPIFARIDDDDIIRFTCTGENSEYQQWLASQGETPPDSEV